MPRSLGMAHRCLELDCQTRRFTFAYFCQLLHLDTLPLFVFYLMV